MHHCSGRLQATCNMKQQRTTYIIILTAIWLVDQHTQAIDTWDDLQWPESLSVNHLCIDIASNQLRKVVMKLSRLPFCC